MRRKICGFLVLFSIWMIWSCSSNHDESTSTISVNRSEMTFDSNEDMQVLTVSSSDEWEVSGQAEWCTVSPDKGSDGQLVTVKVKANETSEDRTCTLTFTCREATLPLEVLQYGKAETNYADLKIGEGGTITNYNVGTGELKVQYDQSAPPKVEVGKALVLPQEYDHAIRVVKNVQASGNRLTLQTEEGNMSNIFKNINFTLATDPGTPTNVRSASGRRTRVVTPQVVYLVDKTEGAKKIYEKSDALARGEITNSKTFYTIDRDFSEEKLYEGSYGKLFWEKCYYGVTLQGIFDFEFGETLFDGLNVGELQKFEYYLQGDYNMDFLLKYKFKAECKQSETKTWENILPFVEFGFMIGNVPIWIKINTHWGMKYEFNSKADITASAGFYLGSQSKTGLSWQKDAGVTVINELTPSFTVYDPIFTFKGSLYSKVYSYPKVEIEVYNFVGPWFSVMPYVEENLEAGLQATASGNNQYIGWKSKTNAGIELDMGLAMDFGLFERYEWKLPNAPYSMLRKTVFEAPYKIELVSPEKNATLTEGTEQEVTFRVTSYSDLTPDNPYNCPLAYVQFSSEEGGKIEHEFVETDAEGLATVKWTPKGQNDKLTAKVVDKDGATLTDEDGNEIGMDVFEPIIEKVEIELISHKDKDKIELGSTENVQFKVSLVDKDGKKSPKYGTEIEFAPEEISAATTDEKGIASVDWAPKKEGDRLTAKVVNKVTDKDGKESTVIVTAATFTPTVVTSSIALLTPADGTVMNEGESISATFLVQYLSEGQNHAYPERKVYFSSTDFKQTAATNAEGKVTLKWTPKGTEDVLTAEIRDKDGTQLIKKVTFTPQIKGKDIMLVSPSNGQKIKKGESVTVTFAVKESHTGTVCPSEPVSFSATSGTLGTNTGKTEANGTISVVWTPTTTGDVLTAQLNNGKKATFRVVIEGNEASGGLTGTWGAGKQTMMVLRDDNTITLFQYGDEGTTSETHPYTYNETTQTISSLFDDVSINIKIVKLTRNILISPFFSADGQNIPLIRLTDDRTGYDVEDERSNSKLIEGQWKDIDGVQFTFNANGTFAMKDMDGENISGTYAYDPVHKTIKMTAAGETENMPVISLNKDLLIMQEQGEEEDAGEVFDWILYKP